MDAPTITVKLDGGIADEHRIDARDLAAALLQLAETVEHVGRIVAPDAPVRLTVQATPEGSFVIEFLLTVDEVWEDVVQVFTSPTGTTVVGLTSLLTSVAGTVIGVIGLIQNKVKHDGNPTATIVKMDETTIVYPDGTTVATTTETLLAANDAAITKALRQAFDHFARNGIHTITLTHGEDTPVALHEDDLSVFDQELTDDVRLEDQAVTMEELWRRLREADLAQSHPSITRHDRLDLDDSLEDSDLYRYDQPSRDEPDLSF